MAEKKERNPRRPPAATPRDQENRMISLATHLAEKQLKAGTASSQVITHYLKLATEREQLEKERLRSQNLLDKAKIDQIKSQKRTEEMFVQAIEAMKSYGVGTHNG